VTTTPPPTSSGITGAEYRRRFEGLVFGTGQYGQATCPSQVRPPSSSISTYNVVYSSGIPRGNIDAVVESLEAIGKSWGRSLTFNKTPSDSFVARARGIVAINVVADISAACNGQTGISGCTGTLRENGETVGIETYIQEGSAGNLGLLQHEVAGHGFQQACHVDSTLASVMTYKISIQPLDLKTQGDMNRAGVRAGDSRDAVFAKMDAIGAFSDENANKSTPTSTAGTMSQARSFGAFSGLIRLPSVP
jgi:hypothetical protein